MPNSIQITQKTFQRRDGELFFWWPEPQKDVIYCHDIWLFNTQYVTNPTIVNLVKMEYGWNFSISGLKMMVKSGLEKIFLKFLHALTISY